MSLYLRQIETGPMQNFVYLIGDTDAKKCWLVDPAWDIPGLLDTAKADGYSVEAALITHSHFDHCNGLQELLKIKNMPVYVQKRELDINREALQSGLFGFLPKENIRAVGPGDTLTVGTTFLRFLHTPGHTPGSQCFLVDGRLIAGDTLFIGTCGRCDLPGGNAQELFDSLNGVIAKLPDDTILYPGHNYAPPTAHAPLAEEKKRNRFLQSHSLEEFLRKMKF